MGGSNFDFIAQGLQRQQQIMEELLTENKELRRQLAELRAGHDIFVEIGNTRVALSTLLGEALSIPPTEMVAPAPQVVPPSYEEAPPIAEAPTAAIAELPFQDATIPERAASPLQANEQQIPSRFLEEMMIDEFSSAMTNPVSTPPEQAPKQEATDEEKKAALRRELMGSFLLE